MLCPGGDCWWERLLVDGDVFTARERPLGKRACEKISRFGADACVVVVDTAA